jgi:hypothetical protein
MLTETYKNRISKLAGLLKEQGRIEFLKDKFDEWSDELYKNWKNDDVVIPDDLKEMFGDNLPAKPRYKKAMSEIFNQITGADPSTNKQNSQWIMRLFTSGEMPLEDLYKATEYLTLYEKAKHLLPVEQRDILKFKNLPDLYDVIAPYVKGEVMSKSEQERATKLEGADRVYEDSKWLVIRPKTEAAACLYGKDSQWCTTSGRFESYNKQGPLYIIFDKRIADDARKNPMRKMQFHFETNQFMDATNKRLPDVGEFFRKNSELLKVFIKEGKATAPFLLEHRLMPKEEVKALLFDPKRRLEFISEKRGKFGPKWVFDYLSELGELKEVRNILHNDKEFLNILLANEDLDALDYGFSKLKGDYKSEMAEFLRNNDIILDFLSRNKGKTEVLKKYLMTLSSAGEKGQRYAREMYVDSDTIYNIMKKNMELVDYYSFLMQSGFLKDGQKIASDMLSNKKFINDLLKDYGNQVYSVLKEFVKTYPGNLKESKGSETPKHRNSIFEEGKKYLWNIGFISDEKYRK